VTSCGDESEDPKPVNEFAKFDGSWLFQSVNIDGEVLIESTVCDAGAIMGSNYKDVPKWSFKNLNTTTKRMLLDDSCPNRNSFEYDITVTKVGDNYEFVILDGNPLYKFNVTSITENKVVLVLTYSSSSNISYVKMVEKGAIFTLTK